MLATELLDRSVGLYSPFAFAQQQTSRQLHALQPATHVTFNGRRGRDASGEEATVSDDENTLKRLAHRSGVNVVCIEKFEGRHLVSGAANGNISMWDLEANATSTQTRERDPVIHSPVGTIEKSTKNHSYGITGLSFYPFDSLAFLASSYDHTVKVYDSTSLNLSATFDLNSVVYSHAISPIASHLLIACATQHPAVRLVDLRSGSTAHSLTDNAVTSILSVAWSPKSDNILASGGGDGSLQIWDVRRGVGSIGILDMEDSTGITEALAFANPMRHRQRGKAHFGPVNGLAWTEDGRHLVSTGHDERVRVWNMAIGANTLASFGPTVRNSDMATKPPLLAPQGMTPANEDILFFPNAREILMFEMYEGRLMKRLRTPNVDVSGVSSDPTRQRNVKERIVHLAWRAHHLEMLSAHADGTIRSWQPRTTVDAVVDENEIEQAEAVESEDHKRKRQTLDDIYREVTAQRVKYI